MCDCCVVSVFVCVLLCLCVCVCVGVCFVVCLWFAFVVFRLLRLIFVSFMVLVRGLFGCGRWFWFGCGCVRVACSVVPGVGVCAGFELVLFRLFCSVNGVCGCCRCGFACGVISCCCLRLVRCGCVVVFGFLLCWCVCLVGVGTSLLLCLVCVVNCDVVCDVVVLL